MAPAARVVPHRFAVTANSSEPAPPSSAMEVTSSVPVPLLVTLTVCVAEVVPSVTVPKARLVSESVTAGVPEPVSVMVVMAEVDDG